MPYIRFTIQVNCQDEEPSRVVPKFRGQIFEYGDDSDEEISIGRIDGYLVMRGRAIDEGVDLFDAMDSISTSTTECFEALFEPETGEWNEAVENLYDHEIPGHDVIFIETLEIQPAYRGKGVGGQVVRETIATFGASCGLVACKPFALQYANWMDEDKKAMREQPGFEAKRVADFSKVTQFWIDLGFRNVPKTKFYTFAPQLVHQPMTNGKKRDSRHVH